MSTAVFIAIRAGLVLLLWMPLVVTPATVHPTVVGKALYARALIEVVAALWLVLLLFSRTYRPRWSWVLIAFAFYVLVTFLSALAGVDFTHSLWSDYHRMVGVMDLVHWFLLALVAASVLRTPRAWLSMLNWNLAVGLVLSLLALAQAYLGLGILGIVPKCRVDATLGNPSYLAAILPITTLIATALLARSFLTKEGPPGAKRRDESREAYKGIRGVAPWALLLWRLFWFLTAASAIWVLFLTGTRGALVGLLAGAIAMPVALVIWGDRRILRPIALGAGVVLVAAAGLFGLGAWGVLPAAPGCRAALTPARLITSATLVSASLEEGSVPEGSVGVRLEMVAIGLRAFRERPILGWGQANFARAFDRFANASLYRYGLETQDQAHNQVVEEITAKGVFGGVAYGALWLALVWAVVRRRRPPGEEALAYGVLGALASYFVQNLVLFDTPATLLQWVLLVAWVAAQERAQELPVAGLKAQQRRTAPRPSARRTPRPRQPNPIQPWGRWSAVMAVVVMLGLAIYLLNYRPYQAASTFRAASKLSGPLTERLSLARRSFGTFPGMASFPRLYTFVSLNGLWERFTYEEQQTAARFVVVEAQRGLVAAPRDARLLAAALPILQVVAESEGKLEQIDPLLDRLRHLAPQRLFTYQLLAGQVFKKGNYEEAIRLANEFEAMAPSMKERLQSVKQAAEEALRKKDAK